MEWTTIDYGGTEIRATDFLNGVLILMVNDLLVFIPGYYVKQREAEMDGPALRERKTKAKEFGLILREYQPD